MALPLSAQSGHYDRADPCPLLGAKRGVSFARSRRRPLLPVPGRPWRSGTWSIPIPRKKVLHYLTLDIIGDTPTRLGDKASDLSLDLLLTRLKNSAEDAPQYAGLVCVRTALGRSPIPEARAKIPSCPGCQIECFSTVDF